MILYICIAAAVVLAGLIIFVATRPADFRITRFATIAAPQSVVFDQINDFHNWVAWSPWARMDPQAKNTFAGEPSGVGAMFTWVGNKKVGEGKMTLLQSDPEQLIRIQLDFYKPFQATNYAEFTLRTVPYGTYVSWTMRGKNNFMSKAVGLFLNMDKIVGDQFKQGLLNLNEVTKVQLPVGVQAPAEVRLTADV